MIDGAVENENGRYAGSWLRNPPGSQHAPFSLEGRPLYVKIGHLPAVVRATSAWVPLSALGQPTPSAMNLSLCRSRSVRHWTLGCRLCVWADRDRVIAS